MSWQLFRLGRWSFQHRKLVVIAWVLLLVGFGVGAATLSGPTKDTFEIDGIESIEAQDLLTARIPQAAVDGATARVVFEAPDGETLADADNKAALAEVLAGLKGGHVASVTDPFATAAVSDNQRVAYSTVAYDRPAIDLTSADQDRLESVRDAAEDAGLRVAIGGDALPAEAHAAMGELIGIAVAIVVLAVTLGSLLAAGMPLVTALVGVGVGVGVLTLATGFIDLSATTPVLGTMLGLAVGIDYALFITSRYQHEIREGQAPAAAAGRAVGTAGSAVVFAGLTVIIALCGLSVCGVSFLTQMGLGGAVVVGVAVLISLTLLPAVLGFAGKRALPRRQRKTTASSSDPKNETRTGGRRWVEALARRKWVTLIGGVAIAGIVSIPVASMQLAVPDDGVKPAGTDARVAYDLLSDNFGAGFNGPLLVVVDTKNAADPLAAVQAVTERLQGMQNAAVTDIAAVADPIPADPTAQQAYSQQLEATQVAAITVTPKSGPAAEATNRLVADIRADLAEVSDETGARALVSGQTAISADVADKLIDVFPLYLAVVVGLAFILLVIVFRSILVPLKAAIGFLLSVGVSLGATVAVFQWGWLQQLIGLDTTTPVMFMMPILLTGILFGLAMDYEVFLVTRMREAYVHGRPARDAVIEGFTHSARVVTAAAVIMIGVFAGFALADDAITKSIGFALAVGVLADAFLVRMLIVPAVMLIVGDRMWWLPKWLNRLVPNVDLEGEALTRHLDGAGSSSHQETATAR